MPEKSFILGDHPEVSRVFQEHAYELQATTTFAEIATWFEGTQESLSFQRLSKTLSRAYISSIDDLKYYSEEYLLQADQISTYRISLIKYIMSFVGEKFPPSDSKEGVYNFAQLRRLLEVYGDSSGFQLYIVLIDLIKQMEFQNFYDFTQYFSDRPEEFLDLIVNQRESQILAGFDRYKEIIIPQLIALEKIAKGINQTNNLRDDSIDPRMAQTAEYMLQLLQMACKISRAGDDEA